MRILDVGVGANAIYPLLGTAVRPGWHFVGVDISEEALEIAARNVAANERLQDRIELRMARPLASEELDETRTQLPRWLQAMVPSPAGLEPSDARGHRSFASPSPDVMVDAPADALMEHCISSHGREGGGWWQGGVLRACLRPGDVFHASICNPPFFEDMRQAGGNQRTNYGGTATEMTWPGGEMDFCLRMVIDSYLLRGVIATYSTMVGKKETLTRLRALLGQLEARRVRTFTLEQGRTYRWVLAWSFPDQDRQIQSRGA